MGRNRKNKNKKNSNIQVIDKSCPFTYSIRLEAVLLDIADNIAFAIMGSHMTENNYGFRLLDMSDRKGMFRVFYEGKKVDYISTQEFLDTFFDNKFSNREIEHFTWEYDKRLNANTENHIDYKLVDTTPFRQDKFEYKPKDIFYTFTSLCFKTYPFGTEDQILKYMPIPLEEDGFGNYFIKIGESDTMFTSHLDSATREQREVRIMSFEKEGYKILCSDGKSILSADDKAGVTIMLYMIEHNIPGLYYFFIGEERGGIGSGDVAKYYEHMEHCKGIKKCVSFDRRNYHSIITHQGWTRTCSDTFAQSLADELNKNGMNIKLDNTGVFTDSANFIDNINECTNISVGYFSEHTKDEYQNITFLEQLCNACIKVDWANLTISRKIGQNTEIIDRNYELLLDFKNASFYSDVKIKGFEDRVFIQMCIVSSTFEENYEDICEVDKILEKWNLNPYIYFVDDADGGVSMNIELQ
jgi:hypothetical protein